MLTKPVTGRLKLIECIIYGQLKLPVSVRLPRGKLPLPIARDSHKAFVTVPRLYGREDLHLQLEFKSKIICFHKHKYLILWDATH